MKNFILRPLFLFCLTFFGVGVLGILKTEPVQASMRSFLEGSSVGNKSAPPTPVAIYVIGGTPALQSTPLVFPTLSPTATLFVESRNTPTPFGIIPNAPASGLAAFIFAPSGVLPYPYVILTAFEPAGDTYIEIKGYVNLSEFVCKGSPCGVPLTESSTIVFKANNSRGDVSDQIQARVRVESKDGGYLVIIESVNQFTMYRDACAKVWGVKDEIGQSWSQFPQSPFQLNTDKRLHLLISRLISTGIVDAKDCPGGGLGTDANWPTGCGADRANSKMIEWQNQFDFSIWSASAEVGIPPKLLKTIIETESQFWPTNQRFYVDEFGLGQITQLGIDVLLRRDPTLYQNICPEVLSDCSVPYTRLDTSTQALIRGAVLDSINADCPSCANGLDIAKANQSVPLIAQLVKANCEMVDYLDLAGKPGIKYEDLWKFTLASYHSGFGCVRDAVKLTRDAKETEDWDHISLNMQCHGAEKYVNNLWGSLLSFDSYLLDTKSLALVQIAPTFSPTRTPILAPTAIPSSSHVWVRVYMDANSNGAPDGNEWLDGITVELVLRDNTKLSGVTSNGQMIFNMTGYPAGMDAIVSLPGLYRDHLFSLPKEGLVQIDFVFAAPKLPIEIP